MVTKTRQILESKYKILNFKLNKNNISNFEIMENRRQIGESHVSRIHGAIQEGRNPMGVLIVNKREGKMRLIDGNHRMEAVRRFLGYKKNEGIEIECLIRVYDNLNDEEERQVYSDEAKRKNESHEDRLNMYKDTIIFWTKLLQDNINPFPCKVSIYQSKQGIRFRIILNALYTVKNGSDKSFVPGSLKKEAMVLFAQNLDYEDYKFLKEFIIFFEEIFGKVERTNVYTKSQFFIPLMDIYYRNIQYRDDKNFGNRFKRVLNRSDIISFIDTNGREWKIKIRKIMIEYMNHGVSIKKFI